MGPRSWENSGATRTILIVFKFYGILNFLKVIVLSPTRELAQQLFDAAATYTRGRS